MQGRNCLYGSSPTGGVTFDNAGNLYGTTAGGGSDQCDEGCGTVFELSPTSTGWIYTRLGYGASEVGTNPYAPLVIDPSGAVYGSFDSAGATGAGALFEILPGGQRNAFSLIDGDGDYPLAALVLGDGVVYGAAYYGPSGTRTGAVFQVTSAGAESVLHTFCSEQGCGRQRPRLVSQN